MKMLVAADRSCPERAAKPSGTARQLARERDPEVLVPVATAVAAQESLAGQESRAA
jgi:hypothetical protein